MSSDAERLPIAIGVSGFDCTPGIDNLVTLASDLRLSHLELWPHNLQDVTIDDVRHRLQAAALVPYALSVPSRFRLNHVADADHVDVIREALQTGSRLGCHLVNIKLGIHPHRQPLEALLSLIRLLRDLGHYAEQLQVRLCVENMFDDMGEDPNQTKWSRCPTNFRILLDSLHTPWVQATYDPCNFLIAGDEPYPFAYGLLAPHLAYVHVKDARLQHPLLSHGTKEAEFTDQATRRRFTATTIGTGAVSWSNILAQLLADRYQGVLMLDCVLAGQNPAPFYDSSLQFLRHHLAHGSTPSPALSYAGDAS